MELKAKKDFTDKYTGKEYKINDIIKVDDSRGKELLKSPYELVEIKKSNKKEKEIENDVQAESNEEIESKMQRENI